MHIEKVNVGPDGSYKLSVHSGSKVEISFNPETHELINEDGIWYVVEKHPEYPLKFDDCANIVYGEMSWTNLGISMTIGDLLDMQLEDKMCDLTRLIICRNAYWKLYGERNNLGKPWMPNFSGVGVNYGLYNLNNEIVKIDSVTSVNLILTFPNAKMRDKFYNNFRELIESCKEFL